jgi:hypothetical protein
VKTIHRSAGEIGVARSTFVRDLTRRLLRLTPLLALDALTAAELDELLGNLVSQSKRALDPRQSVGPS